MTCHYKDKGGRIRQSQLDKMSKVGFHGSSLLTAYLDCIGTITLS